MEFMEKIKKLVGNDEPLYESIFVFDETSGCESNYMLTLSHAITCKEFTYTENFPGLIRNNDSEHHPYTEGFKVKGFREKYFNELFRLTVAELYPDTKKLFFKWADRMPPNKDNFLELPDLPNNLQISHFSSIEDYLKEKIPISWLSSVGLNKGNSALLKFRSDFQRITYYLTPLDASLKIFEEFRKEYMEKHAGRVFVLKETNELTYFRNKW